MVIFNMGDLNRNQVVFLAYMNMNEKETRFVALLAIPIDFGSKNLRVLVVSGKNPAIINFVFMKKMAE